MQAFLASESKQVCGADDRDSRVDRSAALSLRSIQGNTGHPASGRRHGPRHGPISHGTDNRPHATMGRHDHFEIIAVPNRLETDMSERLDTLKKARERMIYDRDKAERARIKFVEIQGVIDAIDRAISSE